jgi:hypothetical protein
MTAGFPVRKRDSSSRQYIFVCYSGSKAKHEMTENVLNWLISGPVINYLVTLFGAIAMFLFSLAKGFEGSKPALKRLLPGKLEVLYDRLDFILIVRSGSIIGTIFFRPGNPLQALSAGFGWTSAVNILASKKRNDGN